MKIFIKFIIFLIMVQVFALDTPQILAENEDRITVARFEVIYTGFNRDYAELVLKNSEKNYARISQILGHRISKPVKIILTKSDRQFKNLTNWEIPDWSTAVAKSDSLIIVTPLPGKKAMIGEIIAHEIVHIIIDDASGGKFVPRWFHEGCAQNYSGEWGIRDGIYMTWKVSRGKALSFADIQEVFSSGRSDAVLAYDQSQLAVKYLISINGENVIAKILNFMKIGNDFPTAFMNATGLWPSEFETEYLKSIKKSYGWKSLTGLIPGTWTLILIIALIVYVVKKLRTRAILKRWEREELPEIFNFESHKTPPDHIPDESEDFSHEIIDFDEHMRKYRDED